MERTPSNDNPDWSFKLIGDEIWLDWNGESDRLLNLGPKERVYEEWVRMLAEDDFGERP